MPTEYFALNGFQVREQRMKLGVVAHALQLQPCLAAATAHQPRHLLIFCWHRGFSPLNAQS